VIHKASARSSGFAIRPDEDSLDTVNPRSCIVARFGPSMGTRRERFVIAFNVCAHETRTLCGWISLDQKESAPNGF